MDENIQAWIDPEITKSLQPFIDSEFGPKVANNPYWKKLSAAGKRALPVIYFLTEWRKNPRDWISIAVLAKEARITYDQADNLLAQFMADRQIPKLWVIEEIEE